MNRFSIGSISAAALLALSGTTNADVLITEVVDATLPGGLPKWVEITNTGSSDVDLSLYSIGNINNGGTNLGGGAALVLGGTLPAGQSIVGSYEADPGAPMTSNFYGVYTTEADFYFGGAYINGDDCIALYLGAATGDGTNRVVRLWQGLGHVFRALRGKTGRSASSTEISIRAQEISLPRGSACPSLTIINIVWASGIIILLQKQGSDCIIWNRLHKASACGLRPGR